MSKFIKQITKIAVLLVFLLVLTGGGGSSGTGGRGGLLTMASGILLSSASMPISGALVSFPDKKTQAVTNSKGEFKISDKLPQDRPVALKVKLSNSEYTVPIEGFRAGKHVKVGLSFDPNIQNIKVDSFEILAENLEKMGEELEEMGEQLEKMGEELDMIGEGFNAE